MNGDEVGKISKQWSGLAREMFTDADFFGINFPMDLDARMKAVMLGACFLIVTNNYYVCSQYLSKLNSLFRMPCSSKKLQIMKPTAQECFELITVQKKLITIQKERR